MKSFSMALKLKNHSIFSRFLLAQLCMLAVFIGLTSTSVSYAQEIPTALPVSLKDTMKGMSERLKKITAQAADAAHNSESQKLAEEFVELSIHAKTFIPKKVEALPAADRTPALDKYVLAINQSTDLGQQLAAAFKVNDNTKATDLLNQLAAAKKEGHAAFK